MLFYLVLILLIILLIIFILKKNDIKESFENNGKYTAIIIEPRKHKALQFVLDNFCENLSNEWNIIILHGNTNIEYIKNMLNSSDILKKNSHRITLKNLNVDNLTIKDYNNLLVSKEFYNNIPTEIFLIFQTDSIICKKYKDLINNYIKYDYVGAPWRNKNVGNGGLSLRKKSKMLEIIENCRYSNNNEDLYFSHGCPQVILNKPEYEDSKYFSVETDYSDISFGVHKPWKHLSEDQLIEKTDYCEGLDILTELNKK